MVVQNTPSLCVPTLLQVKGHLVELKSDCHDQNGAGPVLEQPADVDRKRAEVIKALEGRIFLEHAQ